MSACWKILLTLWALGFGHAVAALDLKGDFIEGGLAFGQAEPGSLVFLGKQAVPLAPNGDFILGFHRDSPQQMTLSVTSPSGQTEMRTLTIKQRTYKTQRINGLPADKVNPPQSNKLQQRIKAENKALKAARLHISPHALYRSGFMWPAKGRISGVYGSQRILNGQKKQPHYGVDIAAPTGTTVYAPADGIVTLLQDNYFGGRMVVLDHGFGLTSSFLHLSAWHVKQGQAVRHGTPIGAIGSTGRSTGPHLDWRMNWFGARIDPQRLVGPMKPTAN